ncbi:MAG: radical SAM protein [Actinobacteria bacterium]|nr:radical SAM protein [Actinomycetota bacterium]
MTVHFPTGELTFSLPKRRVALWNVNPYCNLECGYCYGSFDGASFKQTGHRPPTVAGVGLRHTAEALRLRGVDFVYLGGGEPLLRNDLAELVDTVSDAGVGVRVTSNLTVLPPAFMERFTSGRLSRVTVSLDSLDADYNDAVRGRTAVVRRNLDVLLSKRSQSRSTTALGLYCVVTAGNLGRVPELLYWAIQSGFDYFSCQPVALPPSHPLASHLSLKSEHETQLLEVFDQLRAARSALETPGDVYLALWRALLHNGRGTVTPCPAGTNLLYVSESGEVWRCPAYDVVSNEEPLFRIDGQPGGSALASPCSYLSYDCLCMWELMYPHEDEA